MQFTITTVLAFMAATTVVSGLGINCQGSSQCSQGSGEVSRKLTGYINKLDDGRWVDNGVQIACVREPAAGANSAICAFMQGTGGASAKSLKALAQDLVDHGCNKCGSVPLFFPSDNNPDTHGILTFNYVANGCGKSGLCI
ncbi:putative MFS-type transporter [Venturia nashicola]|uniref:Putative MFS-type transporter n=1 Tax=Venturia nashicola TaxID=86259 RepID=A0A4Z1PNS1_9PEZI|nr:putative MFS-type transporter [Venturia nashicola]TLD37657.1 putative MFS-type transporter [Venturia nashicola]